MRELVISKYEAGQRFDKFLAKYLRGFLHFSSSREAEVWLLKDTKFVCRLTASE